MTTSSNMYGEALKGYGPVPPKQGIYEISETQKAVLGQRLEFADGRIFRYAKAGATDLAPGKLCKAGVVNNANCLNDIMAAAVTVGSKSLTLVTSSAVTTGAEGWLQINDVDGEGIMYKIEKTAANATTSTSTDITLYDPIATALTTSSQGTIIFNSYEQVEVCSAITDIILGVPPVTVTAEYYFWIQTWGVACVLSEGITPAGQVVEVAIGDGVAGVTTCNADSALGVGVQMLVGVDTEYKPVSLRINP
uniref:Uncharacterized protein n=1 Tax=viral metagenome TaxID=1070528 RepID=A0A6M3LMF9_9ZZZZ